MRISLSFETDNVYDADRAALLCRKIADGELEAVAKSLEATPTSASSVAADLEAPAAEQPTPAPTARRGERRGRPPGKTNGNAAPAVAQAELEPDTEIAVDQPEPDVEVAARQLHLSPQANEEAIETAREQLRQLAKTRGVLWLREVLAANDADRLSHLTGGQVLAVLAGAGT